MRTDSRTLNTARSVEQSSAPVSLKPGQTIFSPPGTVLELSPLTQQQLASLGLQAVAVVNPVTNQATLQLISSSLGQTAQVVRVVSALPAGSVSSSTTVSVSSSSARSRAV